MIDWLASFSELEDSLSIFYIYLFLAFSAFVENVFPPWPGDTTTVVGGFLAYQGLVELPLCMLAVLSGNLGGALIMYFFGEKILLFLIILERKMEKPRFLKSMVAKLVSKRQLRRSRYWFRKWGILFILFSRFSAGVRFFVSAIAGIFRMNLALFLASFSLAVLLWNSLLLWGGYKLGENWRQIEEWLRLYNAIVILLLFSFLLVWVFRRKLYLLFRQLFR